MKNKPRQRKHEASQVLGFQMFCAITAVEGLHLSSDSKARIDTLVRSKLTPDERRAEVLKAYSGKAGK